MYSISGQYLKSYISLNDAYIDNISINKTQIRNILNHSLASTHNLIFLYEEDADKLKEHILRHNQQHKGKIKLTLLDTNEIIIFNTMKEASEYAHIDRHTIRKYINKQIIKHNQKWEDD